MQCGDDVGIASEPIFLREFGLIYLEAWSQDHCTDFDFIDALRHVVIDGVGAASILA